MCDPETTAARVTRPPGEGGAAGTGAGGWGESPQGHPVTRQPEGPRRRCRVPGRGWARPCAGLVTPAAGPGAAVQVPGAGLHFPASPAPSRKLTRGLVALALGLHFPQAFSAPEAGSRYFRRGVRRSSGGGERGGGSGGRRDGRDRARDRLAQHQLPAEARQPDVSAGPRPQRWVGRGRVSAAARGAPAVPVPVRAPVARPLRPRASASPSQSSPCCRGSSGASSPPGPSAAPLCGASLPRSAPTPSGGSPAGSSASFL